MTHESGLKASSKSHMVVLIDPSISTLNQKEFPTLNQEEFPTLNQKEF